MQFGLAWCLYRTPFPAHPLEMLAAFTAVCFAFLGMGLVIAMLAGAVPAVQALGQVIFLPMIMIGGVGVPLRILPAWAQQVAAFLPGRYAVEALDACYLPGGVGLGGSRFALGALFVIGAAACIAGSRMFRWDAGQKLTPGAKPWIVFALAAWAGVGLASLYLSTQSPGAAPAAPEPPLTYVTPTPTVEPSQQIASATPPPAASPTPPPHASRWQDVTQAEIDSISFANLPSDDGVVAPVDRSLDDLSPESKDRMATLTKQLDDWPPGLDADLLQRVRNLLSAAAVFDVNEDPDEGAAGYVILNQIRRQGSPGDLEKVLAYIIDNPNGGIVVTQVPELGSVGAITADSARERSGMYAAKLLKRVLGK
jgi:ABC-2 type transport system permease protein